MNIPISPRKTSPTRAKNFRFVHRYLGLALLAPVLLLAITGGLLEFTDKFGLGVRGVPFSWVHKSYGISTPGEMLQSAGITQIDDRLFSQHRHITVDGQMQGAYELALIHLVFLDTELILLPKERTAPPERNKIPTHQAIGLTSDRSWVLDTTEGFRFSHDLGASWQGGELGNVQWLEATSHKITPDWARRYGEASLSWERWLQDLHSGRFFGRIGVWIMSFAAIAFIALAVTGCVVWFTTLRSR